MTFISNTKDFGLEAALGNVSGYSTINKFGVALDADNGIATDIWDGADGALSTDVWVPPTQARVHDIVSTSAIDVSTGLGCQTLRVYGLTDWDTAEVSEDIAMNGVTNVPTVNSYVIIHRMKGLTFGGNTGSNTGTITATAQTDATITAAIQPLQGQTLMAIYGIPSTQTLAITTLFQQGLRSGGGGAFLADGTLLVKENADLATGEFITKERWVFGDAFPFVRIYGVPKMVTGPAIVKLQVLTDANDVAVTGAFDAYVVDN